MAINNVKKNLQSTDGPLTTPVLSLVTRWCVCVRHITVNNVERKTNELHTVTDHPSSPIRRPIPYETDPTIHPRRLLLFRFSFELAFFTRHHWAVLFCLKKDYSVCVKRHVDRCLYAVCVVLVVVVVDDIEIPIVEHVHHFVVVADSWHGFHEFFFVCSIFLRLRFLSFFHVRHWMFIKI